MLTANKKAKLIAALKQYRKKFLSPKYTELDESATRIMINSFLTDVLGFQSLDEVKTEYMIKGTYSDYVVQLKGRRHFLVEVKALGIELSEKHLRQAVNYGANEGIDWALLTNGKNFELYRIIFGKPISSKMVFAVDLGDDLLLKGNTEKIQYMTKIAVEQKGLENLWNKFSALNPQNLASLLYTKPILRILHRELKRKYKEKFSDEEICNSITRIIEDKIENVKPARMKLERRTNIKPEPAITQNSDRASNSSESNSQGISTH